MEVARYGQAFKDRAVARLLPPESAALEVVAREVGIGSVALQRWLDMISIMLLRPRGLWPSREHGKAAPALTATANANAAAR